MFCVWLPLILSCFVWGCHRFHHVSLFQINLIVFLIYEQGKFNVFLSARYKRQMAVLKSMVEVASIKVSFVRRSVEISFVLYSEASFVLGISRMTLYS